MTNINLDIIKSISNKNRLTDHNCDDILNKKYTLTKILNNCIESLNISQLRELINEIDYHNLMEKINKIQDEINNLSSNDNYLSLIKKIIDFGLLSGSTNIIEFYKLVSEYYEINTNFIDDKLKNLSILYRLLKTEIYVKDSEINNEIVYTNINKKNKNNILKVPKNQKINFTKMVLSSKANLLLHLNGMRITIQTVSNDFNKSYLLVMSGYTVSDDMSLGHYYFKEIINDIRTKLDEIDIKENYKNLFLKSIPINDYLCLSSDELIKKIKKYNEYSISWGDKSITDIVKDFIKLEILQKVELIYSLLLDDEKNKMLVNLLFDIINTTHNFSNTNIIYNSIHWELRKDIKINNTPSLPADKNVEELITYEKKIQFMNCNDTIKSKAHEKLKEIQNNKSGEGSSKAIQYLEGLFKIPFGIYKKDYLRVKLDDIITKVTPIVNTVKSNVNKIKDNNEKNVSLINKLNTILDKYDVSKKNIISIDRLVKELRIWCDETRNCNFEIGELYNEKDIRKLTKDEIKNIIAYVTPNNKVLKKDVKTIKLNFTDYLHIKDIIQIEKNHKYLNEYEEFVIIFSKIEHLINIWTKYIDIQNKYLKDSFNKLDESIYGLPDAKKQIKRLLAQWINGNDSGCVIGLEGPPGTGKTTLAKNGIAKCLRDENNVSKPVIFIPLGGSSNGSTLEGHNYTYVGSTWGKIVDGLMDSKCMNPIIYIDELDKISKTEHGKELIGILTHMTDPAQNNEFTDKYFSGIKFDISKSLIIFSYNDVDLIDKILLDRIQRIHINSLSKVDKLMVAKNHIIPEILDNLGISNSDIVIDDNELLYIIENYTLEAGARKLKEKLYELLREINLNYLSGTVSLPFNLNISFIDKTLDVCNKIQTNLIHTKPQVGLMNGLYATSNGLGGITVIEAFKFPSTNHLELKLTGQQGDVMKESMNVAKTVAFNLLPSDIYNSITHSDEKFGIHIHCPEGATPKDGPSAGAAITIALVSLLCNIPIKNTVAITGEIDLNGNILPIGGLESKLDGGKKAGILDVCCPTKNMKNIEKIRRSGISPETDDFKIHMVENIYEALKKCLLTNLDTTEYFRNLNI